ncbi:SCO family protein [Croceibacterium salegens]|uniref:SCO family protein n=1 Tax=Croceibacterium salegens TaxID=1737568 RepID=UPI001F15832E|nr:SCO family protein [Croceibacterium salegens]
MPRTILAAVLFPFALAACQAQPSASEEPPLAGAAIGGPFTLQNSKGETVNWSDFDGKYRVVYFGYTYCPDVCPTDVGRIMRGYAKFQAEEPELAKQVVPLFISVDPKRDTPAVIGEFTNAFSDDLIGLTGTQEQIDAAAKEFAVYVEKGEPNSEGGYLVNHSSAGYLMGRKGEPVALLPIEVVDDGTAIAAELAKWVH